MKVNSRQKQQLLQQFAKRHGLKGEIRFRQAARGAAKSSLAASSSGRLGPSERANPVERSPEVIGVVAQPPFAVRMLNRMTYGATPAEVAAFNALGSTDTARLTAYVDRQVNWRAIDDSAMDTRLANAGYTTLNKSITQLWADHVKPQPSYDVRMRPAWETQRAALARAIYSKRQLHELLVDFWHNHFNVTVSDYVGGPVFPQLDRIIRDDALGNFRSMLGKVAESTAMMYFLDNRSNTRSGPNENFARELLELHTFGAENYLGFVDPFEVPPCPEDPSFPIGYTDIDVYETASAFTGWSVRDGHWQFPTENDGTFVYRQSWHDAGPKFVLGKFIYPEQPAMKDGKDIMDRVARHPRVAKYICKKLIRRFITDNPPQALIDSAAQIFRDNVTDPAQLAKVMRHILLSDTALTQTAQKVRRPFESIAASLRVMRTNWTPRVGNQRSDELFWLTGFTGHLPYEWPAPNGYPDTSQAWSGANTFASEWRVMNWLSETTENGAPICPLIPNLRASLPTAQWTATNIVNRCCNDILGFYPTAERRQVLIRFLAQNGDPNTYVITDTDSWAANDLKRHYNHQRIRSMISLLLMTPEYLSR